MCSKVCDSFSKEEQIEYSSSFLFLFCCVQEISRPPRLFNLQRPPGYQYLPQGSLNFAAPAYSQFTRLIHHKHSTNTKVTHIMRGGLL